MLSFLFVVKRSKGSYKCRHGNIFTLSIPYLNLHQLARQGVRKWFLCKYFVGKDAYFHLGQVYSFQEAIQYITYQGYTHLQQLLLLQIRYFVSKGYMSLSRPYKIELLTTIFNKYVYNIIFELKLIAIDRCINCMMIQQLNCIISALKPKEILFEGQ